MKKKHDQIEFNKWYEREKSLDRLHYMFGPYHMGTNVYIRGELDKVAEFIHQLDLVYFGRETNLIGRIHEALAEVLRTGNANGREVIAFSNDRIRLIRRLDDKFHGRCQDGPLIGSPEHLEITHNEQYGGAYPAGPLLSSRAEMIDKVLRALNK